MHYKNLIKEIKFDHANSMMVALVVPDDVVATLKKKKILDPNSEEALEDKIHITLLYLGKNNNNKKDEILKHLQKIVKDQDELTVQIGGFGKFTKGEDGIPFYATIDCPGLNILQTNIENGLKSIVKSDSEHGFFPHITLGYAKNDPQLPSSKLKEQINWKVDSVYLCVGDEYLEIKFKNLKEYDTHSVSHEPFQNTMRKQHPAHKKALIGHGKQAADVAGSPYKKKPDMKRSLSSPPLGEVSAAGIGAVEGSSNLVNNNKKDKKKSMIIREIFLQELKLRQNIQKMIKESYKEYFANKIENLKEEIVLRDTIRDILNEKAKSKVKEVPYSYTGINVLEELLKRIIPVIEVDYKMLTTSKEQRESYRSHIINGIQNTLLPHQIGNSLGEDGEVNSVSTEESKDKAEELAKNSEKIKNSPIKEEVNVNIGNTNNAATKDNPVGPDPTKQPSPSDLIDIEDKNKDLFTISDLDMTGRNMALTTFEKIERNIIDSYSTLSDEEDQQLFYDYLVANIKLYCDKWESELKEKESAKDMGSSVIG